MIQQQQPGPFFVLLRVKDDVPSLTVISRPRILGGDIDGPTELLCASGNVECMQALMVVRTGVLTHGDQIHRPMRSRRKINYGSRRDSDLRRNLSASAVVRSSLARLERGHLPKGCPA